MDVQSPLFPMIYLSKFGLILNHEITQSLFNQMLMQNAQWDIFWNWWPNARIRIMTEIFEKNSINFDKLWAVLTNFSEKISKIF